MRKMITIVAMMAMMAGNVMADEDVVQIVPVAVTAGAGLDAGQLDGSVSTTLNLCNSQDYIALQFDINVPQGMEVYFVSDGCSRIHSTKKNGKTTWCHQPHMSTSNASAIAGYDLYSVSVTDQATPNHAFVGNSGGDVLRMYFGVPSTFADGTYPIYMTNIQLTKDDRKIVTIDEATSYITVGTSINPVIAVIGVLPSFVTSALPADATIDLTEATAIYGSCSNVVNAKYTREMSNEWGTVVLPYDITYEKNDGYKLYYLSDASINDEQGYLTLTEYNEAFIQACTPMVVKATGTKNSNDKYGICIEGTSTISSEIAAISHNGQASSTGATALPSGWNMNGTFEATNIGGFSSIAENPYFIAQGKFWRADAKTSVAPFRAWFETPASAGSAKSFNIVVEDETDGILQIENGKLRIENSGKFIENDKIVIIKNGKKFNINGQEVK